MNDKSNKAVKDSFSLKDEIIQIKTMIRHFFIRFTKNDTLQLDDQRTGLLIFALTFLFIGGGYIASKTDKFQFITYSMALTGLFAVFNWDNMFLDRRDFQNLLPLPVRNRTIYISKFFSVLAIVGIISLAFSGLSVAVYTVKYILDAGPTISQVFLYGAALFLTAFFANLFIFLLLAALQSILFFLFRGNFLVRVSLTIQVFLLFGLGSMFVWFPRMVDFYPGITMVSNPYHYVFPPLWFNGLYLTLLGKGTEVHAADAIRAFLGLGLPMVIYLVSLPLGLKRFLNSTAPTKRRKKENRITKWLKKLLNRIYLRKPEQRAVFYFFINTIKRIKQPKIHLALFLALPVGFIASYLLVEYEGKNTSAMPQLDAILIVIPFLLYFLVTVGLRSMVENPIYPEANWIFKLTRQQDIRPYITGVKKSLVFSMLFPLFCVLFGLYMHFWGVDRSLIFSVYGFVNGILMLEFLFLNYHRIPFTSLSNPEGMNLKTTWPAFFLVFLIYFTLYNAIGPVLVKYPLTNIYFYAIIAAVFWGLVYYRKKQSHLELVFDDEPISEWLSLSPS